MPKRLRYTLMVVLGLIALAAGWRLTAPTPSPVPAPTRHSYSQALEQAHNGQPGAARVLYQQLDRTDLSAAQRVKLYAELPNYPSPRALKLATADAQQGDVMVRRAAIAAIIGLVSGAQRSIVLGPLLEDENPTIRHAVASALLALTPDELGLYFAPLETVLDDYVQTLEEQPDEPDAQLQLARIYLHDADFQQADRAVNRALANAPDDAAAVATQLDILERQGKPEQARQILAEQLQRYPESADLQAELGDWLRDHDQDEYALLALAKAVELAPDDTSHRYKLAVALHDLEQVEAAQKQLEEILRRDPANREARVLLIDYWKETGQLQNVQVLLAELEQQNADDPALQQGL